MKRIDFTTTLELSEMPSYDSSRSRFRLADRHLAVFGHLVDGETPPEELLPSLGELQQIGLVGEEGELAPLLRDLVTALAEPSILIQAEVTGHSGPVSHGIVVGQTAVIAHEGWPGEEESEYLSIEPKTLVWELSRQVNLQSRKPENPDVRRIETTMGVLDAAFVALSESDGEEAAARRQVLAAVAEAEGDIEESQRGQFAELVLALNASWRITTAWDGKHDAERAAMVRGLAVWDCGPLGYWIREVPAEPILPGAVGPRSELHLSFATSGEIWEKIANLLPDKADMVDFE